MKIGVFDSGIGGEAIALALTKTFPNAKIVTVNDKANIPYGDKTAKQIISLTIAAIQPLLLGKCNIIVIACNTATAVAIEVLRKKYPNQKFVGIEPMIKTASKLSQKRIIAVCATPATLASKRYDELKIRFGVDLKIIEPDCSKWAKMIEQNEIDYRLIESTIKNVCDSGADVIVLGCTHYHWIKDIIVKLASDKIEVIEPSEAIGRRIRSIL